MKENKIAHRDLKLINILVKYEKKKKQNIPLKFPIMDLANNTLVFQVNFLLKLVQLISWLLKY